MTRRDDFVLLVHAWLMKTPGVTPATALDVLAGAMSFPEEVFGKNERLGVFALEYCRWAAMAASEPHWVSSWKENEANRKKEEDNRVTIKIDREAQADQWWMLAESLADTMPKSCIPIVCGREDQVVVSRADADHFCEWGQGIPGWDACPFRFFKANGELFT